jgi:pimeloyl-ACP methyl ester carboxylesterase
VVDKFVDINDTKICYEVHGEGHPLVLIHGFAMYKDFWKWHINDFSKEFRMITLDLRGCGDSEHPFEPYSMSVLANDVKELLDYLDVRKAHIGGHSFGGMVAQHFALNHHERLNKLILMSTFANLPLDKSGLDMYQESQLSFYNAKVKDPTKAFWDKMKQRFSRSFYKEMNQDITKVFHNKFTTEELMLLEQTKGTSKPQDILNQIYAIANHNTLNRLHEIQNETIIMAATKDRIVSSLASELLNDKIPNSEIFMFKSSHFFMLEEAPEFISIVLNFLKE